MSDLDDFIDEVTVKARQIAAGGSPSELGIQIWAMTLTDRPEIQVVARPLSLIFGSLTDPVDWPGREFEIESAEARIRRATEEWLAVAHDAEGRHRYFERWPPNEIGGQVPFSDAE
jgi:hypothetical protein